MMKWLFIITSTAIAVVYYVNAKLQIRDMEEFSKGIEQTMKALTGAYNAVEGSIEEIEDETPYYFPPGLPKETEKEWMIE